MKKIISYKPELVKRARELRKNMTVGEISLWSEIKGKQLGVKFSRQIPIDQYIVDFYCKDLKLAIEVDGSIHLEEGHPEKDAMRQRRLESLGIVVIRFRDVDARNNLSLVLDEIRKTIKGITPL